MNGTRQNWKRSPSCTVRGKRDNVRMLRILVSAHCLSGNAAAARQHWKKLPAQDQHQMKVRCARFISVV